MKGLIIIGCNDYNTLGCIRGFWVKGVEFLLLLVSGSKSNMILKSRAVKDYVIVADEKEALRWLLEHTHEANGVVLLPTSDKVESVLDLHYDDLVSNYTFPHSKGNGMVTRMMDKGVQVEMARGAGLNVPQTTCYHRGDALPDNISYPAIVKQERSTEGRKRKMMVCHNKKGLENAVAHLAETSEFLIQQYIKRDYELLLVGCRLKDGRIWMPAVFKKERWMLKGGDGSYGVISTRTEQYFHQMDNVYQLLNDMDYYGPFSVEFGIENGKAYFYEVNMRNDGTSHYYYPAEIFVPYIYYLDRVGQLKKSDLVVHETEHYFIDEFGDMRNLFHGLSIPRLIADLRKAKSYKYYWKGDNAPFFAKAPNSIASSIYKMCFG